MTGSTGQARGHDKPALLMIHGWGFGPPVWQPLTEKLEDNFRLLTPALPGYNDTATGDPVRLLGDLLEEQGEVFVLGWSLGGLLAIELAARFPDRVQALGLIAALPCFNRGAGWPAGWSPAALAVVREKLAHDADAARQHVAALSAHGDTEQRQVRGILRPTPAVGATVLMQGLDYLTAADLRQLFRELELPVSVWLGAEDALLGGDCAAALTGLRSPTQVRTLNGAGHALLISAADAIAADVTREWF